MRDNGTEITDNLGSADNNKLGSACERAIISARNQSGICGCSRFGHTHPNNWVPVGSR